MIRIEWEIGMASSHGKWYNEDQRVMLQGIVEEANERYGAGTHWIGTK